jgi:hypothetical protein
METGQSVMGDADAPLSHYEGVVRASKYSRIQVLLCTNGLTRCFGCHRLAPFAD